MADKITGSEMIGKVIEHLSKEIQTITETTMTFRTRIAFVAWIGPFILLSSFVVSTKGHFSIPNPCDDPLFGVALAASGVCYLVLAHIGGQIEQHAWKRCDKLRQRIITYAKLRSPRDIWASGFEDKGMTRQACNAYWWTFWMILISFLGVSVVISHIGPIQKIPPDGATAAVTCRTEPHCFSRSIVGQTKHLSR